MKKFSQDNMKDILWFPTKIEDINKERVNEVIQMLKTDNLNIYVSSPTFEGKTDKREKWMQTNYSFSPFSETLLKKIENP